MKFKFNWVSCIFFLRQPYSNQLVTESSVVARCLVPKPIIFPLTLSWAAVESDTLESHLVIVHVWSFNVVTITEMLLKGAHGSLKDKTDVLWHNQWVSLCKWKSSPIALMEGNYKSSYSHNCEQDQMMFVSDVIAFT